MVVPELLDVRVLGVHVHVAEEGVRFEFIGVRDYLVVSDH